MNGGSARRGVSIALSDEQIEHVVGAQERNAAITRAFGGLIDAAAASAISPSLLDDPRLSSSLLSGLLVLATFPQDRSYLGNLDVAETLNMSRTTTHRYITTLRAVGLLERDPATRKYRRA